MMEKNTLEKTNTIFRDLISSYKKIYIAYSGGVDSHALLHLLSAISKEKPKVKLTAIHINHNVSSSSQEWAKYCSNVCKKWEIKHIIKTIPKGVKADDHSLEEILRKKRYEIFAKILPQEACLVTAHHADDQAETLLLQLFRGAGPKGLAAMPIKAKFAKGWLVRPLLGCLRNDILAYARKHAFMWVEDESNVNTRFDRNLIRHKVIPLIKKRWPAVITTLNRVSKHCAEASELLDTLAENDLQGIVNQDDKSTLNVSLLKVLPLIRQKNLIRFWISKLNLPLPSEVKLQEVIRTVVNSRYDAIPVVKWLGAEVRRYRSSLYAMPPLTKPKINKIAIARKLKLDPKKITIRFRRGGEKIKLQGRKGTRDLKKLMQEWDIPPWMRDQIPLVYSGKNIIAVVGCYPKKL